jgi:hypothetical protein
MAAMPTQLIRHLSAAAILATAVLAACSTTQEARLPPTAPAVPDMCQSSRPPQEPACAIDVILNGATSSDRQSCIGAMNSYMSSIDDWRGCHTTVLKKNPDLSDHDRSEMIASTNYYADYDLKNAQANIACLNKGKACSHY